MSNYESKIIIDNFFNYFWKTYYISKIKKIKIYNILVACENAIKKNFMQNCINNGFDLL